MTHDISAPNAKSLVDAYDPAKIRNFQKYECLTFDEKKVLSILSQEQCASLRIYFAQDPVNAWEPTVVLVGVDATGKDIVKNNNIAEYGIRSIASNPLQ